MIRLEFLDVVACKYPSGVKDQLGLNQSTRLHNLVVGLEEYNQVGMSDRSPEVILSGDLPTIGDENIDVGGEESNVSTHS